MTTDLWMLLGSVVLTWALMMISSAPTLLKHPLWALGNRDEARPAESDWQKRWRRTSKNMKENLPLFAILVLVVHVLGKANSTTALGAEVFLGARVAHAAVYMIGVPYLRTAIWAVSIAGMVMIASVLL